MDDRIKDLAIWLKAKAGQYRDSDPELSTWLKSKDTELVRVAENLLADWIGSLQFVRWPASHLQDDLLDLRRMLDQSPSLVGHLKGQFQVLWDENGGPDSGWPYPGDVVIDAVGSGALMLKVFEVLK